MTGYEIRNAMKQAYGFDAGEHLFDTDDRQRDDRSVFVRLMMLIAVAMKGVL